MEIKNSPHLASDSGACVPSSLRQQKTGVHGRAWVLDTHMCTSAHIQTTHTHTAHKHACTCTHTHNPRLVNCLHPPHRDPQPPPCKPLSRAGRARGWTTSIPQHFRASCSGTNLTVVISGMDWLPYLFPEVHSRSEAAGMQNWTSPPHSLTFMGSLSSD